MLGRRGPAQAAFTTPELKEFGELDGVDVIVDPRDLELDPASEASLADDKTAQKNMDLLRKYAANTEHTQPRRIVMRFLTSPVELIGENGHVVAVRVERNRLVEEGGSIKARGTGEFETIPCGLILRSVGYKGMPLPGVPFNESSATISNVGGRVAHNATGEIVPGEYVVGWAKRGPSGVIGTNKPDSGATVAAMVEDVATLPPIGDEQRDPARIVALLREKNIDFVTYDDWKTLDRFEVGRGNEQGRPRIKATSVPEMMEVIRG
jgi:ferredoxin/flavodoxin---NADP+ reductase